MNFTPDELQEYLRALKDRVCSICRRSGYEEACKVGAHGVCPFEQHLPRLLEAVLTTPRSPRIADYIPNIRKLVCSHCENQSNMGVCQARNLCYCSLDSFLVIVVSTIEDVYDRLHPSTVKANRT